MVDCLSVYVGALLVGYGIGGFVSVGEVVDTRGCIRRYVRDLCWLFYVIRCRSSLCLLLGGTEIDFRGLYFGF